jgi:acyl-CoA thioesterase-1
MRFIAGLVRPDRFLSALKRSYGTKACLVHRLRQIAAAIAGLGLFLAQAAAADRPVRIVALGDSLTAGLNLAESEAFPAQLERALKAKGLAVEIQNAGVSGDTASGGLARLDWSVPDGADAVIVELGANDMLRGIDPRVTRKALDAILARLQERRIPVLLCGMRAAPNLGGEFGRAYESIFPELAVKYGVLFYPFFLEGMAAEPTVSLPDGLHPNVQGVAAIVSRILPKVEQLVARAKAARG